TARTPEFASEARGWLARIYHLQGDSAKATKIYLDELHRKNSNLSTEVLITSLKLVHGQRGSRDLMKHLEEYFDTPQHAAFAIHTLTNPIRIWAGDRGAEPEDEPLPHARILKILEKHRHLFRSDAGSRLLALMSMRVALRGGDPKGALQIASHVPGTASIRKDPDFQWMLGSSYFLSRDYAGAEQPLLALHGNPNATPDQRAAAAYGLCGVYQKTRNPVEQLRFALWLTDRAKRGGSYRGAPSRNVDFSIYWAPSGWDLALLLDTELSIDDLRAFLDRYPTVPEVRMVKYGLAVRLARVDQYEESARVYESIGVRTRAQRMRVLSKLHREASNSEDPAAANQAKYRMAQFLEGNSERIYFNDMLWTGLQRYAFGAEEDPHFTRDERELAIENERRLQDEQEERWRAYHLLKEIVETSKDAALRRKSAELSLRCLRRIATDRFGREEEVRAADIAMSRWLHRQSGTLR
ncbi:MAG: hypothetical protein JNL98_40000, partial [Bryobacterales bacterium]|nr:hypothetical protein [Bryobacterales bacterium]